MIGRWLGIWLGRVIGGARDRVADQTSTTAKHHAAVRKAFLPSSNSSVIEGHSMARSRLPSSASTVYESSSNATAREVL
jgi:hypothetical protein